MSRTEQMTDLDERAVSAAEADLERVLSVEPSPEFMAKVRNRIAAEPPVRNWSWGRLGLAVAAASAVLVVFVLGGGLSVQDNGQPSSDSRHEDVVLGANPADAVVQGPPPTPVLISSRA